MTSSTHNRGTNPVTMIFKLNLSNVYLEIINHLLLLQPRVSVVAGLDMFKPSSDSQSRCPQCLPTVAGLQSRFALSASARQHMVMLVLCAM